MEEIKTYFVFEKRKNSRKKIHFKKRGGETGEADNGNH